MYLFIYFYLFICACSTAENAAIGNVRLLPKHHSYMQIVPRDAATLLPIIQQHVVNGTTVWSDEWAAYNNVATLPNVVNHDTVNHSVEFVAPSGVHTQNIESYWDRVKIKLKRMRGCHEHQLASYLDEFMYRERYGSTASRCFNCILRAIATQYPV